ncbi:uncharacterized protein [Parasteatoda tepidariorum]|uniref:uncharacterized protein n=1 Tax=Parasteatoda tepidariorum TaxID=114398 RepID=UPI00077FC8BE|nr:uncharacterized protein LOC107451559 [Parasteatoda tepidariorum]
MTSAFLSILANLDFRWSHHLSLKAGKGSSSSESGNSYLYGSRSVMNKAIAFLLVCSLAFYGCSVEAQRNRQTSGGVRGGTGGRGSVSGGPSGIRFPTEEEQGVRGGNSARGFRAGRWPGGFYGGIPN